MRQTVRFAVDPRLATLLGDSYRSTEQAVKELVDNAWDADAEEVIILLPEEMSDDPILVTDNGSGMTEEEMRTEYLKVARDRRLLKGDRTTGKRRQVRGRRGIGKFAGLMIAEEMQVTSNARGRSSTLVLDAAQIKAANSDFEAIKIPFSVGDCDPEAHGTTVMLSHLNQRFTHPNPEKLRRILVLDYGRATDFTIKVNGQIATLRDIPGQSYDFDRDLPVVGNVKMLFAIAEGKYPVKHAGIVIKVNGKPIGDPSFFGLDQQEDVPPQVLKRVYGEIEADGLLDDVTADWGAVIENSVAYRELERYVQDVLREELQKTFKREFNLVHARIKQQIEKRLAELPEHRRPFAQAHLEKILQRFYGENEDKIEAIVSVVLDALERDEYWAVLREVHKAERGDVEHLANALTAFGLLEIVYIGRQAKSRLELLDSLDKLVSNPATLERQLHLAIEHNLWLLGSKYSLVSSNRTMKSIVETYLNDQYSGDAAAKRPDLLLLSEVHGHHLLIEFKRPEKTINRDDEAQAQRYQDDFGTKLHPIKIWLVGGSVDKSLRLNPGNQIEYYSYADLVGRARAEVGWLMARLAEPPSSLKLHIV